MAKQRPASQQKQTQPAPASSPPSSAGRASSALSSQASQQSSSSQVSSQNSSTDSSKNSSTDSSKNSSTDSSKNSSTDSSKNSSKASSSQVYQHIFQSIPRIVFHAGLDAQSHPLLVICASRVSAALNHPGDFNVLTQLTLSRFSPLISSGPYSLIIFASPSDHAPSIKQILSSYQLITPTIRKNLKAVWVVHPTFWAKMTVGVLLKTIVSWKMSRKVHWANDLSTLASLVPIHQICIPPEVYKHDLTIEPSIIVPSSLRQPPLFGARLEDLIGSNARSPIPQIIQDCVNCIRSSGMKSEGLFRRPPALTTTQIIRDAYNRGHPVIIQDYPDAPFVAASLIKAFLRDLPEPIFLPSTYSTIRDCPPIHHQPIIIPSEPQSSSVDDSNLKSLKYIKGCLLKLLKSPPILALLDYIIHLCYDLALCSEHNKMDPHNLATCLAPTMIKSNDLMSDAMMCKLPNSSSPLKSNVEEPTTFASVLKFMIACYPLCFEPIHPTSRVDSVLTTNSSLQSSDSKSDDPSRFEFVSSPVSMVIKIDGQDVNDGHRHSRSSLLVSSRRINRYPSPVRGCISQVGLSCSYSSSQPPKTLERDLNNFSTLQISREFIKPSYGSLSLSLSPDSFSFSNNIIHPSISPVSGNDVHHPIIKSVPNHSNLSDLD